MTSPCHRQFSIPHAATYCVRVPAASWPDALHFCGCCCRMPGHAPCAAGVSMPPRHPRRLGGHPTRHPRLGGDTSMSTTCACTSMSTTCAGITQQRPQGKWHSGQCVALHPAHHRIGRIDRASGSSWVVKQCPAACVPQQGACCCQCQHPMAPGGWQRATVVQVPVCQGWCHCWADPRSEPRCCRCPQGLYVSPLLG